MTQPVSTVRPHDILLIGGGPAALGALCAMIRTGAAEEASILMMDDAPDRCGRIGGYAIGSDTQAKKFLNCLDGLPERIVRDAALQSLASALAGQGENAAPLSLVGEFLARLKRLVLNDLRRSGSLVLRAARCDTLRHEGGLWSVDNQPGAVAHRLVLACGASERRHEALPVLQGYGLPEAEADKVMLSSELFGWRAGEAEARLMASERPRVVILGGSHSAIAAAHALLDSEVGETFGERAVRLYHRRPMTATFASEGAAREAGYADFGPEHICPVTQRVHALGGFRLQSRELLVRMQGWEGAPAEPRVEAKLLSETSAQATSGNLADDLARADLVVSALGYSVDFPRTIVNGAPVRFGRRHLVDADSRLHDADGRALPSAQALGLSMGYDLRGRFGETGFDGEANGLALWFKEIGETIARPQRARARVAA